MRAALSLALVLAAGWAAGPAGAASGRVLLRESCSAAGWSLALRAGGHPRGSRLARRLLAAPFPRGGNRAARAPK